MNAIGKVSTLVLVVLLAWCAAHWTAIRMAWKYRHELELAGETGRALADMGVIG